MTARNSLATHHQRVFHTLICTIAVLFSGVCGANGALPSAKNAAIRITAPANGALVVSPVKVSLKAERMVIMPAGVPHPDSGHYHILIDSKTRAEAGKPATREHQKALDKGEREIALTLSPGNHTLQAVLVDHLHRPHNPIVQSEPIEITVIAPLIPAKK